MVLQAENVLLRERERAYRPAQTLATPKAVYIQATVEKLDSPRIPFAVLKQDPIAVVRHYLEDQSLKGKKVREEQLYDAWNSLFTELMPEQHFFLYAWASVPRVSSAILQMMGLLFVIATPGPSYTRWLTTRPVWYQGTLVAWCVPVDMRHVEQERIEKVQLSEDNMLRFTSAASWWPAVAERALVKSGKR